MIRGTKWKTRQVHRSLPSVPQLHGKLMKKMCNSRGPCPLQAAGSRHSKSPHKGVGGSCLGSFCGGSFVEVGCICRELQSLRIRVRGRVRVWEKKIENKFQQSR